MTHRKTWWKSLILYSVLILFAVVFLFPVFMMLAKSLMTQREATVYPPMYWASSPSLEGYVTFFEFAGYNEAGLSYMFVYLMNTLQVVLFTTVGTLFSSTFVAYGFTKMQFPGRNFVFFVTLATMMIPSAVTMVPLYIIFSNLGWTDSLYPLWVPMCFGGGAVNIFLVRQYMLTLPRELNESASIDGAGPLRQYFTIIMPNCVPIMMVVAIGCITGSWNDLQGPLTYITSQDHYTLTLAVGLIGTGQSGMNENVPGTMAACTVLMLPPILLFIFGQKYFIENVVMSGVKG